MKIIFKNLTFEELYDAYIDCRRHKRGTVNALEFEMNESYNLLKLYNELITGTYEVGRSIAFCVQKPKPREVFAGDFRDRIVHHLLINRVLRYLEAEFIDDSYSCIDGKGTAYGVMKCHQYIKEAYEEIGPDAIIVKCDLKSFFMTINKDRLKKKLIDFIDNVYAKSIRVDVHGRVHDTEEDILFVKYLIDKIVSNNPQQNYLRKQPWKAWKNLPRDKSLFYIDIGYGLPVGNLTSQFFANFYLSAFDHYMKDELSIKWYGRYVDDFFFICRTSEEANSILAKARTFLDSEGVILHPNKVYIQPIHRGVKFIGSVIYHNRTYIANRTKGNFYSLLKRCDKYLEHEFAKNPDNPKVSRYVIQYMICSINSYLGFMQHHQTYNIRHRTLIESGLMKRLGKFCYLDRRLNKLTLFRNYSQLCYDGKPKKKIPLSKKEYFNKMHKKTS